jgi:hypothetical protein
MRTVDQAKLVAAIAARLNDSLPAGVRVDAVGTTLTTYGTDGVYAWYEPNDLLPGERDGDYAEYIRDPWPWIKRWICSVLDGIQDDVAHATRGMAWPPSSTSKPLPLEWAEVRGQELHLGYGDTSLAPIPIAEIMTQSGV